MHIIAQSLTQKRSIVRFGLSVLVLLLAGCSSESDHQDDKGAAVTPIACKNPTNGFAIMGGEATTAFPQVHKLEMMKGDEVAAQCTGSFYSEDTLVFAAHCIKLTESTAVRLPDSGESSTVMAMHPDYKPGNPSLTLDPINLTVRYLDVSHDLAVAIFSSRKDRQIVKIGPRPDPGAKLVLVGYGVNSRTISEDEWKALTPKQQEARLKERFQTKRIGYNAVEASDLGVILTKVGSEKPGDLQRGAPGDSGSTLFDEKMRAVGILSGAVPITTVDLPKFARDHAAEGPARNGYVDINSDTSRAFLKARVPELGGHLPIELGEAQEEAKQDLPGEVGPSGDGGSIGEDESTQAATETCVATKG